jgi:hypothetical protein
MRDDEDERIGAPGTGERIRLEKEDPKTQTLLRRAEQRAAIVKGVQGLIRNLVGQALEQRRRESRVDLRFEVQQAGATVVDCLFSENSAFRALARLDDPKKIRTANLPLALEPWRSRDVAGAMVAKGFDERNAVYLARR